jgi:hypothetical protein
MSDKDLTVPDESAPWETATTTSTASSAMGADGRSGVSRWVGARIDAAVARVMDGFAQQQRTGGGEGDGDGEAETVALARTGGAIARWISFPRGVRFATAATSSAAAGLAAWGMLAMAANDLGIAAAAAGAAAALSTAWGPIGIHMATRLHRLVARHRLVRIVDLGAIPDRHSVAVRGIVLAERTAASALDGRASVWSLARFRKGTWFSRNFFHEVAFDFLLDDGTGEPIWVEVSGGMLLDPFPPEERVQFHSTTLLDVDHPFLTRLRLDDRQVWASEIGIAPGDAVEVVGRLSRRLDPTARAASGRNPPQRRTLRSGTRVPVMIRKLTMPDASLSRVRRLMPKGPPTVSPGEPPLRKF